MLGRPYHHDPGLSQGILEELQKLGYPIFSQGLLPLDEDLLERLFGGQLRTGVIRSPFDISDVWKQSFSASSNNKLWAAKFVRPPSQPDLCGALELQMRARCVHKPDHRRDLSSAPANPTSRSAIWTRTAPWPPSVSASKPCTISCGGTKGTCSRVRALKRLQSWTQMLSLPVRKRATNHSAVRLPTTLWSFRLRHRQHREAELQSLPVETMHKSTNIRFAIFQPR